MTTSFCDCGWTEPPHVHTHIRTYTHTHTFPCSRRNEEHLYWPPSLVTVKPLPSSVALPIRLTLILPRLDSVSSVCVGACRVVSEPRRWRAKQRSEPHGVWLVSRDTTDQPQACALLPCPRAMAGARRRCEAKKGREGGREGGREKVSVKHAHIACVCVLPEGPLRPPRPSTSTTRLRNILA